MLSWGWNAHRHTSNSEYGRFDFGHAGSRSPANGFELRQGNNTNYIHQTPCSSNNGFHNQGCPHGSQYYPPPQQHQPGCQYWSSSEKDRGDASSTPKFTIQIGDAAAAAALGGNVNRPELYQCKSNYYVPESSNVSEYGGNTALNYKGQSQEPVNHVSNGGDKSVGPDCQLLPSETRSANDLGKTRSRRLVKKSEMQEIPVNYASVSDMSIQRGRKANKVVSPYHLCGKCTKCKNIKIRDNGPPTAVFPSNKFGGSQKISTQNFMHLEGKNFKASAMGRV